MKRDGQPLSERLWLVLFLEAAERLCVLAEHSSRERESTRTEKISADAEIANSEWQPGRQASRFSSTEAIQ